MAVDHDGKGMYSTGLGHGDALHTGDLDPSRPGLEVFQVHEDKNAKYGLSFRDAATGKILWGVYAGKDVGRGWSLILTRVTRDRKYGQTVLFTQRKESKSEAAFHPRPTSASGGTATCRGNSWTATESISGIIKTAYRKCADCVRRGRQQRHKSNTGTSG